VRSPECSSTSNGVASIDSLAIASSPQLYVRSNAVVSRLVAGETLVLPLRGDVGDLASLYTLNSTASTIWDALEKSATLSEISDVIGRKYEISKEEAEQDVGLCVQEMCALGLARIVSET
jgi:hypothetical protein